MERLDPVTFDWVNGIIQFGQSWETANKVLGGATPLTRARAARQDKELEKTTINRDTYARICIRHTPAW